jgi:hypothetical protein
MGGVRRAAFVPIYGRLSQQKHLRTNRHFRDGVGDRYKSPRWRTDVRLVELALVVPLMVEG